MKLTAVVLAMTLFVDCKLHVTQAPVGSISVGVQKFIKNFKMLSCFCNVPAGHLQSGFIRSKSVIDDCIFCLQFLTWLYI